MDGLERALALLDPVARERGRVDDAGYLDLIGDDARPSTGPAQDLMLTRLVPRIYERWWRPTLGRAAKGVFGPGMTDEKRIARLLLALSPGDGVLDIACGTGNFTRDFATTVGADGLVVGVDVSPTMLARAVRETRAAGLDDRVAYVRADVRELPFRDRSFDAVCCFAALHLFSNPLRAVDRMTAALTPGGRIALFTSARTRTAPLRTLEGLVGEHSGMVMFERDELIEALEDRAFVDVRQRVAGFTQFVGGRLAV